MEPFTSLVIAIALLILLAATSARCGVDSREARSTEVHDRPLTPCGGSRSG